MHESSNRSWLLAIVLLWAGNAIADPAPLQWDTAATHEGMYTEGGTPEGECVGLVVSNHGEMGFAGLGEVNLDFRESGLQCGTRPEDAIYLFSGSPFVIIADDASGTNARLTCSYAQTDLSKEYGWTPVDDLGDMTGGLSADGAYDSVFTGRMVDRDGMIALERNYYAPRSADPLNELISFVICYTKIYSADGQGHDHVTVGNVCDWNVPAENAPNNTSGLSSAGHTYMRGTDTTGVLSCQSQTARFATEAFGGSYSTTEFQVDECANSSNYHSINALTQALLEDTTHYRDGTPLEPPQPNPEVWWQETGVPGLNADARVMNQAIWLTYKHDLNLGAQDTLHFWTVLTTVRDGTLADLEEQIRLGRDWYTAQLRGCDITSTRGDLNLDGIPFSIADWVMTSMFGCLVDPGPWPPLDVQEQADIDCGGYVTLGDLSRHLPVLLGEHEPYVCPTNASPDAPRPASRESVTSSETYAVEIRELSLAGVDTGWIEVVLLEAPDIMTGFQFNIEYDSERLEFVDGMLGDHLADWPFNPTGWRHETASEPGKSCLRIVGQHCLPGGYCPDILTLPDLPATLAKLKFRVRSPDEDFETDLNFAWDYCRDNGISVGPETGMCGWWPYYLAVSKEVYNSAGDNVTGSNGRYGGAGDDCMAGGSRDIPIRQIDFHSGTLTYQPDCCQGRVGDANGIRGDEPTIGDVVYIINHVFGCGGWQDPPPMCFGEMDINQSGGCNPTRDDITIGDLSVLLDYLFITGSRLGLPDCLVCPPEGE